MPKGRGGVLRRRQTRAVVCRRHAPALGLGPPFASFGISVFQGRAAELMEGLVSGAEPPPPLARAPLQRQLVFQTGLRKPLLAVGRELPVVLALSPATWASASLAAPKPYKAQTWGLAGFSSSRLTQSARGVVAGTCCPFLPC